MAEATPDLSEFIGLSKPKKKPCQVGAALEQLLTKGDRAALAAACAQDKNVITAGAIGKWLEKRGLAANSSSITHHRQGSCTCHG